MLARRKNTLLFEIIISGKSAFLGDEKSALQHDVGSPSGHESVDIRAVFNWGIKQLSCAGITSVISSTLCCQ